MKTDGMVMGLKRALGAMIVMLWFQVFGVPLANALAPTSSTSQLEAVLSQIEKDMDGIALAADETRFPSEELRTRIEANFRLVKDNGDVIAVFFPGMHGFYLIIPGKTSGPGRAAEEIGRLVEYRVLAKGTDEEMEDRLIAQTVRYELLGASQSRSPSRFRDLGAFTPRSRFVARAYAMTASQQFDLLWFLKGADSLSPDLRKIYDNSTRFLASMRTFVGDVSGVPPEKGDDRVRHPMDYVHADGEAVVSPPAWTQERIRLFIRTGVWQRIVSEIDGPLDDVWEQAQLKDMRSRREEILYGQAREKIASEVEGVLANMLKPVQGRVYYFGRGMRAAQVARALDLQELLPVVQENMDRALSLSPGVADFLLGIWIEMQHAWTPEKRATLLNKAKKIPFHLPLVATHFAYEHPADLLDVILSVLEAAKGEERAGGRMRALESLEIFFDRRHWLADSPLKAAALENAPRLFTAMESFSPRYDADNWGKILAWVEKFSELLPEDYPAPKFVRDEITRERLYEFETKFPDMAKNCREKWGKRFMEAMVFLPWQQAIWEAGPWHARELGLLFMDRKGLVVGEGGAVRKVIFPQDLTVRQFQSAVLHAWVQCLAIAGAISDDPALPDVVAASFFLNDDRSPLKYRIISRCLPQDWDAVIRTSVEEALARPVIPGMQQARDFPPLKYFFLRWLVGERFFGGLYGLYLANLVYRMGEDNPRQWDLAQAVTREMAIKLNEGLPPEGAYAAAFLLPAAEGYKFKRNLPTAAQVAAEASL